MLQVAVMGVGLLIDLFASLHRHPDAPDGVAEAPPIRRLYLACGEKFDVVDSMKGPHPPLERLRLALPRCGAAGHVTTSAFRCSLVCA